MFKKPAPKNKNIIHFPKAVNGQKKNRAAHEPFFNFGHIPPVTKILFWVLPLIYAPIFLLLDAGHTLSLFYQYGFIPATYTNPENYTWHALVSPFTSLLLHSGWMHVLMNMMMMLMMGIYFERQFGAKKMILCLIACGLGGNFFYLILSPAQTIPVIGLSGALNGLLAIVFIHMQRRGLMGPAFNKHGALPFILVWIILIIIGGLLSADISWQSHMGGFLAGVGIYKLWQKGIINL